MTLTLYAIVNPSGEFTRARRRGKGGGHVLVYTSQPRAESYATGKGQTVVPMTFDDGRGDKPVFIRGQVLNGSA